MKTRSVPFVLLAICLCACEGSGESRPDLDAAQRSLNDNQDRWQRANLASYQYTYKRACFCAPEQDIIVIVANRVVTQAFRTPSGTYLTPQELTNLVPIEGLFAKIQDAIGQKVYRLDVTYNAQLGYPDTIYIDHSQNIADDEISYSVRNLQ